MDLKSRATPIRERLIELARRLPETEVLNQSGDHYSFSVRGKKFCYFLVDHHGDGRIAINVKAAPGVQEELMEKEPGRFHIPAYLGPRGWIGFDFANEADWDEINEMLRQSYALTAPKTLAAKMPPA